MEAVLVTQRKAVSAAAHQKEIGLGDAVQGATIVANGAQPHVLELNARMSVTEVGIPNVQPHVMK